MRPGIWELLIVLAIALLIFGPKALPKLGKSLGKTVGNFKKGLNDDEDEEDDDVKPIRKAEVKTESDEVEKKSSDSES